MERIGMEWTGEDRSGAEWSGLEWLFFPPSQKCDCGTSNGVDGMGQEGSGVERIGMALLSAVAEM